jgi:hypothetical protein
MCLILTSIRERLDSTCYRTERFVGSSMRVVTVRNLSSSLDIPSSQFQALLLALGDTGLLT